MTQTNSPKKCLRFKTLNSDKMEKEIFFKDAYWESIIHDDPDLWTVFDSLLEKADSNGRIVATLSGIKKAMDTWFVKDVQYNLSLLQDIEEITVQKVLALNKKGKLVNRVLIEIINYKIYVEL